MLVLMSAMCQGEFLPDGDFVGSILVSAWEVPEEQLARLIRLVGDGHQTGVRLAKVPVDKRNVGAVDEIL